MFTRKLGRKIGHRKSMFATLATSLILYEKVKTTEAKAKEVRKIIDKMINLAKKGDLACRRRLLAYFPDKNAVKKLFEELAPRYKDRTSGYLKMYKTEPRQGDGSKMMILQLIPRQKTNKKEDIQKNKTDIKKSKNK